MKPMVKISQRKNKQKNSKDISFEKQKRLLKNIKSVVDRIYYIFEVAKERDTKESDGEEDVVPSNNSGSDENQDVFNTEPHFDLFND